MPEPQPAPPADTPWPSLPAMLLDCAAAWGPRSMLRHWAGGAWHTTTYAEFADAVAAVAAWLRARGVMPGDRVMLCADSRPEFPIADVAIMAIGAVTVPTYVTNTAADHAHVLRDSGARAAVLGSRAITERVLEAARGLPDGGLDLILCLEDPPPAPGLPAHAWAEATRLPGDLPGLRAEAAAIPPGRLACIIYTSGTGGAPRGVMLPHRAMLANREGVASIVRRLDIREGAYLSFLPLSHSYEHTVNLLVPSLGIEVVYSRGAERLMAEMASVRPVIVTAVPRLFELVRARLLAEVAKLPAWRRRLFGRALALGLRRMDGPALGPLARVEDAVLDRLVRAKLRARFGGRLVAMVSGGARLDPELSGFHLALGLPVLQGYGQTEAGPVVSVNLPWDVHRHTVGPPLPGVEVRIAGDGEVLVRGDLVMDGYWGDAAATARTLVDGWLHTGDVGALDAAGRLTITDRKRDIIKTLGGDMLSPARLEALLTGEPAIAQAVVGGEGLPGPVALLVPAEGGDAAAVAAAVARVNARLSGIERLRRHAIVPAFTAADGTLTATAKVRRQAVLQRHAGLLAGPASKS